jgi:cell division protein YceG involved in septum cleavage
MDAHNLALITRKMVKIKRFLSNYFPEEAQFIEFLGNSMGVPANEVASTNIHQKDFKKIIDLLLDKVEQKLDGRMLEGFFANFTYNTRGMANVKEIVNTICKESDKDFYLRVLKRPNGPAPTLAEIKNEPGFKLPEDEKRLRE